MTTHTEQTITSTGGMLPVAAEGLIERIVVPEAVVPPSAQGFLLGFDAEAADLPLLITLAIREILALADDHDADVRHLELAGLRRGGELWRVWGTIECTPRTERSPGPWVKVREIAVDQDTAGIWTLSAIILHKDAP